MQFEEFDKNIKEAADNHHPAYNEEAWGRMNKLLDKHLPRKEDRRRRFILLFLLLFILGGAGIVYTIQSALDKENPLTNTPAAANESKETKSKETTVLPAPRGPGPAAEDAPVQKEEASTTQTNIDNNPEPAVEKPVPVVSVAAESRKKQMTNPVGTSLLPDYANRNPVVMIPGITNKKKKEAVLNPGNRQPLPDPLAQVSVAADQPAKNQDVPGAKEKQVPVSTASIPSSAETTEDKKSDKAAEITAVTDKKADSVAMAATGSESLQKKKASGKQKKNSLFITVSAGPDASFTQTGKPGRINLVTGAGIGYTIKDRVSFRAGFYQAVKMYSASPSDYNPPANFYNYYPYLEKVDANCRVYEIPVSVGYHFGARKNHSWFASAGLSSYLMKRETYDYYYKTTAGGSLQQKEWTIRNRNQHLFSVLGLSGGYQRKITDRISFVAEPYLKLPFTGVGYGKVRLNSAGVLFSVTVQPAALVPRKQKK